VKTPVELGLGALEVLSAPGTGRIEAVYPKAAYLRLPGGLVALTSFDVPSGPGHARSAITLDQLRVDDRVVVTGSLVQAGPVLLDLDTARVWRGEVPTTAGLKAGRGLALDLLEGAPPSSLGASEVGSAVEPLRKGEIAGVAARLGGLGPGLTPAGDDCLAGILIVARMRWGETVERMLGVVAAMVETNDIARMFLRWAARAQSIEPVHRFLASTARNDLEDAASALDALVAFGQSSGSDLALGLRMGLELLPDGPGARAPGRAGGRAYSRAANRESATAR
jgi:hypothetical protein